VATLAREGNTSASCGKKQKKKGALIEGNTKRRPTESGFRVRHGRLGKVDQKRREETRSAQRGRNRKLKKKNLSGEETARLAGLKNRSTKKKKKKKRNGSSSQALKKKKRYKTSKAELLTCMGEEYKKGAGKGGGVQRSVQKIRNAGKEKAGNYRLLSAGGLGPKNS